MRVALVATHPIQYQVPWYRALSAKGVDLTVYYATLPTDEEQGIGFGRAFQWDVPLLDGYRWKVQDGNRNGGGLGRFFGLLLPGIGSELALRRPDAIILTGWHSAALLQALWAAILLRIPRLVRGDSNSLRPRSRLKTAAHRLLFSFYEGFLAVGKSNRSLYENGGVAEERIFSCPHFVDGDRLERECAAWRPRREELRRAWAIPDVQTCFLFAGKLDPIKRVDDFLGALKAVSGSRAVHGLVVGSGVEEPRLRKRAVDESIPVTFAGFLNQTEMVKAYVAADALVLPSESETWGLVVNEGMACGLPAIVSDRVGCWPDLVNAGVTGEIFPKGDVAALADRMERLCDLSRREAMGRAAHERVAGYSVAAAVEGTCRALEWAVR